jgi:putative nucleotidyltransferase with HDIG domain
VTPSVTELVESCPAVASPPSVYIRISEVMGDPYSSAADFGTVVSEDPGLTARLLRLVNSAFYNLPTEIDSVTRALAVVGTEQLYDLALATSVMTMFDDVPCELVDMESFWRHSLATGVACRVLATRRGEPNVERLFVAGLLHDIGRLLMLLGNPEGAKEALESARSGRDLLYRVEDQLMGYNHADAGAALLKAWHLPEILREPVAKHHEPRTAHRFMSETAMVHVADITAHGMLMAGGGEPFVPPLSDAAWMRIDGADLISPSTFVDIDIQYTAAVQSIL